MQSIEQSDANPKVSVLLAVHNGAEFIGEAIESILAQHYTSWELIIVDNGSTDKTAEVCSRYVQIDSRIRFESIPEKNKNKAYNRGYQIASGAYLCFFGADDLLPPNSLAERVSILRGCGADAFSTCCLQTVSEDAKYDGLVFPRNKMRPNYSGGSVLFSKSLASQIFPLPVDQPNEDTWTLLHLRAFGVNRHVPKALYRYRIHKGNSYGYGMAFGEKRSQYLRRMRAYELFHEKFRQSGLAFLESDVVPFLNGLRAATRGSIPGIMFVKGLRIQNKLVLAYYCSPTMYRIRNFYFRTLSGGVAW